MKKNKGFILVPLVVFLATCVVAITGWGYHEGRSKYYMQDDACTCHDRETGKPVVWEANR